MSKRFNTPSYTSSRYIKWRSSRYFYYLIFVILMILKLGYFHSQLNARNIDMNFLDYVISFGSLLLVSFWVLWLPQRARMIALIVLDVLLSALIYADLVYYRYFQDFITIPVLLQAGQLSSVDDSIFSLLRFADLWFFADLLLLAVYSVCVLLLSKRTVRARSAHKEYAPKWQRFLSGTLALVIGAVLTFGPIEFYNRTWAVGLFTGNWWNLSLYNVTGLLGFHGYDLYRYNKERQNSQAGLTDEEMNEVKQYFDHKQQQALKAASSDTFGQYKGKNVMLVQVEALMNFVINKSINGQEVTPHLNALMKDSLYFKNFYHQTGQGRTSDADLSANISLHPLPTGSVFTRYPDHMYDSLPSVLGEQGYYTGAYHAYESSFWNRYTMYSHMGYDEFMSKNDYTIDEPIGWSLGDKSFFRQSLDQLTGTNEEPFYSFMITLTSHHPYTLPESIQELDVGQFNGTLFGDYLQAVHYSDAALGELIERLKKEGLWENTLFMVYGDHDNSLKEQSNYEAFLGKRIDELQMHQIMNQVPLLLHLPDGARSGVYLEPAGQMDIAPTLLHLLGIPTDSKYFMGNDLLNSRNRMVVLRTGAFATRELYYIPSDDYRFEHGGCYDAESGEQTNVNACEATFDKAKNQLSISDRVITYDLIAKLRDSSK
ncbi:MULTISPECIES: LTA synthase family protein [unclassified Paenibacillus]|uniref:LTA synthase family protein n=1 Tax=unclassified Paenibacillus TaxID=185978 RepID=UPI00089D506A|nr:MULTISPECIES: LTA synthase family protein [unclassified Paenibacillus]OMC71248.1 phosphoglycerol transferase [Paenibacillus sp. FSL H7-0326]SDW20993.1 Phosphoglycerol transferase MdoB [Paenibacillus sp. PDC88]